MKTLLKSFTGIIIGVSLIPGMAVVGVAGAAGRIASLGQTFAGIGLVGYAAKGSKSLWFRK